jgi:hypothetical protein
MSIPKKFYVSRCYRSTEEILGFMVVADAEHTKAFQKKKETADRWGDNRLPKIYVENTPQTGFQMVTNVSRYSTSNVVWRVRHPEGFEFEITSDNFMDLIETSTIIEGAIQEELFFTETRKLVSTKTKLFADLIKKEEKAEEKKNLLSEIKEGDLFRTDSSKNDLYQYCGKYHVLVMNKNKELCIPEKSSKKEVVLNTNTGKYFIRTKIVDSYYNINVVGHQPIDRKDVIHQVELQYMNFNKHMPAGQFDIMNDSYDLVAIGDDKPFKLKDCTVEYEEIDPKVLTRDINPFFVYTEYRGKIMRVLGAADDNTGYYTSGNKSQTEKFRTAKYLFAYDAEILENGQLLMPEVNLDLHKRFSGWRAETPFAGFSNYSDQHYKLVFMAMPEKVMFGKLKIGK